MSVVIHFDAKIENKLSLKTYFQNIFDDGKKKPKEKTISPLIKSVER